LVRRPLFGLLYQPRMIDDECGVVGGMRIGRGNRSNRRKPAPVPLRPPKIPHDLTWDRTLAAAVESRRLTARAMARPVLAVASHSLRWRIIQLRIIRAVNRCSTLQEDPCYETHYRHTYYFPIRGGESLGVTGAKPHFIFGNKKRRVYFRKALIT
jgi:hypothetical protein